MSKDMTESMMESLDKTFDEIQSRDDEPEAVEEKPEEALEPEVKEEEEPTEEVVAKAPTETITKPEAPVKSEAAPTADKSLINPPNTWTAKGKSLWGSLPEEARKEIRKREEDARSGIAKYKEMATHGERFTKAASAYDAYFRSKNIDPIRAAEDAFNLSYSLSTSTPHEKGVILKRIAHQYGADMAVFSQQANPKQDELTQAISPLLKKIEQLEQSQLNSVQTERQRQAQTIESQIEGFAGETDETGKLKHPYFENVKDEMAFLLESGRAKQLDDAYAKACDRDPDIRALIQVSQPANAKTEKDRVSKAKRNDSLSIRKSPLSPAATTAPKRSMRETVEATYESLQNA